MSEAGLEQKYIKEAFDTNWVVPLGPNVNGFEKDLEAFVGENKRVVALSAGTAAVHLALLNCGVKPGDEVIVQSFTFCASSHPITYLGATPVFVDSEKDSWNMDPELMEEAIKDRIAKTGKKPAAIVPVALYGMPYQIDRIMEIANRYDIPVVEDAAEGFGSRWNGQVLGTFGKYGVLSFNGNKMITTSGGGALVTANEDEWREIMMYATQYRESYPYYQHEKIGYNYRMSNICAGIGRGQMTVQNSACKERVAYSISRFVRLDDSRVDETQKRRVHRRRDAKRVTLSIFSRKLTHGFRGQRPRQNPLRWRESLELLEIPVCILRKQILDRRINIRRLDPVPFCGHDLVEHLRRKFLKIVRDVLGYLHDARDLRFINADSAGSQPLGDKRTTLVLRRLAKLYRGGRLVKGTRLFAEHALKHVRLRAEKHIPDVLLLLNDPSEDSLKRKIGGQSLYLLKLIERNYDGSMYMLDGDLLSHAKNLGKRRGAHLIAIVELDGNRELSTKRECRMQMRQIFREIVSYALRTSNKRIECRRIRLAEPFERFNPVQIKIDTRNAFL